MKIAFSPRIHLAAMLLVSGLAAPTLAREPSKDPEPAPFLCAIWPDRVLFFDQTTDTFTDGFRLRHGAVTTNAATFDRKRVFAVTDRMESVEVIDPARREIIGELKLSTPERRVRIFRVYPNASGTRLYLMVSAVKLEADRYLEDEDVDVVLYDLEARAVVESIKLPREVQTSDYPVIHVAPGGESFYVIGKDIFHLDAATRALRSKMVLSKPLQAGYGPFEGLSLTEVAPGVFYGIYKTVDPIQEKKLFGLMKLDLYHERAETVELGPGMNLGRFALSKDRKRGYAGLGDMVVVDMEQKKVVNRKEGFERGRTNNSMIVSHDGTKLYVSGVGDTVYVYDTATLEQIKTVYAGGDFMLPPIELKASMPPPAEDE